MTRFLADRFFFVSDCVAGMAGWFAALRGGVALGPFGDKTAAKAALDDFLYSARVNREEVWGG